MLKDRRKILIAIYALAAIYLLPMFPHGGSTNEMTLTNSEGSTDTEIKGYRGNAKEEIKIFIS